MNSLREYRLRQGQTQLVFAIRVGWSKDALAKVERGVLVPGERLIVRLSEALKLSIEEARSLCGSPVGGTNDGNAATGDDQSGSEVQHVGSVSP